MSELVTYDGSWGAAKDLDKGDLKIPKLMLMQAMSKAVASEEAKPGNFIKSDDGTILGDKTKPVEVIVFRANKMIQVFDGKDYKRTEPYTVETAAMLYDKSEGELIHKHVVMNFVVLLPKDIKDGSAFPLIVSFKNTSLNAGKKLSTFIQKLSFFNKPSAAKTFLISCKPEENDKGKFFVMDVAQGRDATKEELEDAKIWYGITEKKRYTHDEE